MSNLEIEIIIRPMGKPQEVEFQDLETYEKNAIVVLLENQLEQLKTMPTQPSQGLILQQRFESLALQVHHARQLAYQKFAQTLVK